MNNPTLFIVAAGSGGHILPALTLAQNWLKNNPGGSIIVFTGTSALEKKILHQAHNIEHVFFVPLAKFSLRSWWKIPVVAWQAFFLMIQTLFWSMWYKPSLVISTGGLHAIPVCLATRLTRKRTELYELNVIPGKATKALLPIVHTIHTVFDQTKQHCRWGFLDFARKCQSAPYPLRFTPTDATLSHNEAILQIKELNPQYKTIFVLGGSQGSRLLNTLMRQFIHTLLKTNQRCNVIHQTGALEEAEWETFYQENNIPAITFSYNPMIQKFYTASDLIVCRAGAGTMFEILFFKRPCVVIPLISHTTDHQEANARAMQQQHPNLFNVINQTEAVANPVDVIAHMNTLLFNEPEKKLAEHATHAYVQAAP